MRRLWSSSGNFIRREDLPLMITSDSLIARNVASLAPRYPEEKARIEEKLGNLVSLLPFAGREGETSKSFLCACNYVGSSLFCFGLRIALPASQRSIQVPIQWISRAGNLPLVPSFSSSGLHSGLGELSSYRNSLGFVWLCILLILALFANRYGSGVLRLLGFGSANRSQSIEEERDALIAELESIRVH